MKKELINILKEIEYVSFAKLNIKNKFIEQFTEYAFNQIVDEMLKRGIIAPPCKVGDTVYHLFPQQGIVPSKVKRIQQNKNGLMIVDYHGAYYSSEFGITVFKTYKEAEAASLRKEPEWKSSMLNTFLGGK